MLDIMHVKLTTSGAIFHCSSKVLKELGVRNEQIENGDGVVDPFFCWYVHLFSLHRKKCLLFVNVLTRYPVFVPNVKRAEIRTLDALLATHLEVQLVDEGVSRACISSVIMPLCSSKIAKSNNRSVIGCAVEFERQIMAYLFYAQKEETPITASALSLRLARVPISSLRPSFFPYLLFRDELMSRFGETGHFTSDPIAMKRPTPPKVGDEASFLPALNSEAKKQV